LRRYVAVTNDPRSPLAEGAEMVVELGAGLEVGSASKTYVATLVALHCGLGIDPAAEVEALAGRNEWSERQGEALAGFLEPALGGGARGVVVIASGPALGSARQAALVLSECVKFPVQACSVADYDHGLKEAAAGSALVFVEVEGAGNERSRALARRVEAVGARVMRLEVPAARPELAAIPAVLPFNVAARELAGRLGVGETFVVGGKVTEVGGEWGRERKG